MGGPLFTSYTYPLSLLLTDSGVRYHTYADDTQLYQTYTLDESQDDISQLLETVTNWMRNHHLKLNGDKTVVKVFNRTTRIQDISLPQLPPPTEENVRDLGFLLDTTMSLKPQIDQVCKTLNYYLYQIRSIRDKLDVQTAKQLVNWLVLSRLNTFISLYHDLPRTLLNRLQLLLNRAARVIYKLPRHAHITEALKKLGWLSVETRAKERLLILTHQTLKTNSPAYLAELLSPYEPARALRSGDMNLLRIPRTRSRWGDRAFSCAAPKLWDSLPDWLRSIETTPQFKHALRNYLLQIEF